MQQSAFLTSIPYNKMNLSSASLSSASKRKTTSAGSRPKSKSGSKNQKTPELVATQQSDLITFEDDRSVESEEYASDSESGNPDGALTDREEEEVDDVIGPHDDDISTLKAASLALEQPEYNSEDFDTDLEDDFPQEKEATVDPTGAFKYVELCRKTGVVPVSYVGRKVGDGFFRMKHHYLGGAGTKPLAKALVQNTVCEEIDLSDNYIEGSGARALAETLKENMFIVNMNVADNFIGTEGAASFADMLEQNTTLKTLSLQGNCLTDCDAKRIAEALKNNLSLNCINLSYNYFGSRGGCYLAQGLALNVGLADLDLSWNGIHLKGAVALAKSLLKNNTLEILDLSWNGFGDQGAAAIATALRSNKKLKVLDISNNRIGPDGAEKLGKALQVNNSLETFLFAMNPVGPDGLSSMLKGININKSLRLLGIEGCADLSIRPDLVTSVKQLSDNRDLLVMHSTTGSPQQAKNTQTVLAVFERFITDNADRLEDLFNQMDKDKSGDITLEEFKYGLKDFGLRLTSKQLDMLLDELDADKSGTIEFDELMEGANIVQKEKDKATRAADDALMYAQMQSSVS